MLTSKPFQQPRITSSQAHFSRVPSADIPRSIFNRSHQYKTTFDAGYLIPVLVDEILPGDSFKLKTTTFGRTLPLAVPIMDNLYCDIHYWFVPLRLLWSNFEKFMGAQANPDSSIDFVTPKITTPVAGYAVGSISDYMGIPTDIAGLSNVVAFYHRAYNLIWNEWYRDQNFQDSITVNLGNGPDAATDYALKRRNKVRDYFTSCLPSTQKGPAVELPLGATAPVFGPEAMTITGPTASERVFKAYSIATGAQTANNNVDLYIDGAGAISTSGTNFAAGGNLVNLAPKSKTPVNYPYADLSDATAATINEIRVAFQIQRFYERNMRGGTRYIELLLSHFGVTAPDFRLQRPEYLGGGTTMINTSPVPQTSESGSETPQGNLAAMGAFSHHGVGFNHSFVEHGVLLGLMSVRADNTYQQGLERQWLRSTRFDYYWPAFSHLGEQYVMNQEIYAQGTAGGDDDVGVFGYQERYAEYRYKPSKITGKFRSTATGSLDVWHLAQEFTALPELSETFLENNPPMERVVSVPSEPVFMTDIVFDFTCARAMPVYSVPGLIDHF